MYDGRGREDLAQYVPGGRGKEGSIWKKCLGKLPSMCLGGGCACGEKSLKAVNNCS